LGKEALKRIEAIGVEANFDEDLQLRIAALCGDEELAGQLRCVVSGFCALAELQARESDALQFRELVESVQCDAQGRVFHAQLKIPSTLVHLLPSSSSSSVPGLGAPWPNVAQPSELADSSSASAATYPAGESGVAPLPPYRDPCSPSVVGGPGVYGAAPYAPPPSGATPPAAGPNTSYGLYAPAYGESATNYQATVPPMLKIADVLRLVDAGVAEPVIARFVREHRLETRLTVDDLVLLTQREVSPEIITMIQDLAVARKLR
jgi:hypothetical protein